MYKVQLAQSAVEMLKAIPDMRIKAQLRERAEVLKTEPKAGKPLKETLQGLYSLRAAAQRYRIIYEVDEAMRLVTIVGVGIRKEGDRRDIYSVMTKLLRRR